MLTSKGYWKLRENIDRQLHTSYDVPQEVSQNEFVLWKPEESESPQILIVPKMETKLMHEKWELTEGEPLLSKEFEKYLKQNKFI